MPNLDCCAVARAGLSRRVAHRPVARHTAAADDEAAAVVSLRPAGVERDREDLLLVELAIEALDLHLELHWPNSSRVDAPG